MAEIVLYIYIFHFTWIYYNQIAQIWCQSEEGIVSRQLSSSEATARRAGCWETISYVSTGRHLGVSACDTAAFLERDARNASLSRRVCPCMRGTF